MTGRADKREKQDRGYTPLSTEKGWKLELYEGEVSPNAVYRREFHSHYEIILYRQIEGTAVLNGVPSAITDRCLLFQPPYTFHRFQVRPGRISYYALHPDPGHLKKMRRERALADRPYVQLLPAPDYKNLLSLIQLLDRDFKTRSQGLQSDLLLLVLDFISELRPARSGKEKDENRFSRLIRHLDENSLFTISIAEAAEICNLSRSHFQQLFKKLYGKSFHQFLIENKLNTAQRLLRTTDRKITEIAFQLDFTDATYFTFLFRKVFGMTPKAFRKEQQV